MKTVAHLPLFPFDYEKAETNQDGVAYIQILENTNQIKNSLATFRTIMILCMIVFDSLYWYQLLLV